MFFEINHKPKQTILIRDRKGEENWLVEVGRAAVPPDEAAVLIDISVQQQLLVGPPYCRPINNTHVKIN